MNKSLLTLSSAAILLAASGTVVFAHEADNPIEDNEGDGYITSVGNVLRGGLDDCVRSSRFSEDNQINTCEGIEEVAAEPEAEPEPAPAPPAPEPEPTITTMSIDGSASFELNSHQLSNQGEAALNDLVRRLNKAEELESMNVIGHTDSTGTEAYNQTLSEKRAATVAAYLEAAFPGIPVTSSGAGEGSPIATNSTREGRAMNRRVDVDVTARTIVPN